MMQTFHVYGVNHLMGNVMDSHDKVRFMAYADGDISINESMNGEIGWNNPPKVDNPESYKLLQLYYAYMMSIPGVPVVYYGSEFGMTGANDPDNRRMMRFKEKLSTEEKKVLQSTEEMVKLRNEHPALKYGDFYTLKADENTYAYLRSDPNERIIVVLNKSKDLQRVSLTLPAFYEYMTAADLVSGEKLPIERESLVMTVDGVGYKILKLE
jgi:glycosidase